MEKFKKLLEKKRQMGKSLDGPERDAKMSAVQTLKDFANDAMKDKMGDMKKVSVASDSKEGLVEGMEKAKDMIKGKEGFGELPEMQDDEESDMDMAEEGDDSDKEFGPYSEANQPENHQDNKRDSPPEENSDEGDHMDEESINKELERLMSMKKKYSKK